MYQICFHRTSIRDGQFKQCRTLEIATTLECLESDEIILSGGGVGNGRLCLPTSCRMMKSMVILRKI
jgi:hypothetical protein